MTNCLFFGDSITYGEYDGILGGWVDFLKRFCHSKYYNENAKEVNLFNLGIGGETTFGLLNRIETELTARISPIENLVFLFYGANDLAIKNGEIVVSKGDYKNNLISAISKIKNKTDKIYLLSIIPISEKIDGIEVSSGKLRTNQAVKDYNRILKEIAESKNVNYIDLYSIFFEDKEQLLSKDYVHPNEKGYELIANTIKPIISEYL